MMLRAAAGQAGRLLVGVVFLLAGLAKAVDPVEFAFETASYGIIGPHLAALAGPPLIAFEIALGFALIIAWRPRAMAVLSAIVLSAFLGLKGWAFTHGRTEACGCFGSYLQTSPGWGIVLDLVFLAGALLAAWGLRGDAARAGRGRRAAAAGVAALALGFSIASPGLPIDSLVTRLALGKDLRDLGIESKVPRDGRFLVALLDLADPGSTRTSAHLDALVALPGAPKVLALTPSRDEDLAAFTWVANPSYEVRRVERAALKPLYRRLPRFFLVDAGRVVLIRETVPEARELVSSQGP